MADAVTDPVAGFAAGRRARRNRLLLVGVVWLLLTLESVANRQPLSHSPLATGLGAFVGVFAAVQLSTLVGLALGRLGGTAPTMFFLGAGRRLAARRVGPFALVIRAVPVVPLLAGSCVAAGRALRLRLLFGGLCRVGALVALGAALVSTDTPFTVFMGLGTLLVALMTVIGGAKRPGTAAWMIFRAPFADRTAVDALAHTAAEVAVERALLGARFGDARALLATVPANRVVGARLHAAVAIAEGHYAEARHLLDGVVTQAIARQIPGGELLLARATLFGVESGALTHDEALPGARAAIEGATRRIPRLFAATEVLATLALLNGRAADAVLMARQGLRAATDLQTRAFTLCTLAGALAVTGDQPGARATLAEARALAPDLARVATVERLITELPLTRDRS